MRILRNEGDEEEERIEEGTGRERICARLFLIVASNLSLVKWELYQHVLMNHLI